MLVIEQIWTRLEQLERARICAFVHALRDEREVRPRERLVILAVRPGRRREPLQRGAKSQRDPRQPVIQTSVLELLGLLGRLAYHELAQECGVLGLGDDLSREQ